MNGTNKIRNDVHFTKGGIDAMAKKASVLDIQKRIDSFS